jgi:hypothetical protein
MDAPRKTGARGEEGEQVWVRSSLLNLGLNINGSASTLNVAVKTIKEPSPYRIIAPIVETIPSAAHRFPIKEGKADGYTSQEANGRWYVNEGLYGGDGREATLINPLLINQLATFSIRGRTYWLVQSADDEGRGATFRFSVIYGTKTGPSTMVDLATRLELGASSRSGRKFQHGNEHADSGFGSWPRNVDMASVAFDRYLILSGHWQHAKLRWVLVYDLNSDQVLLFNGNVPAATKVDGFGVTKDGRSLVQVNSGGALYFYDVTSGKVSLRGYYIDGELVVYDARGYYTATPEGSQFIFLKFPGVPGYNSLRQFAPTLNRPHLVKAVLAGKGEAPDPRLTPPASLELAVDVAGAGTSRSAKLHVNASSVIGLEKLRVFVDGRRIGDYPLTGHRATADLAIPLAPEARWLAAVAIDEAGYESVAQGAALPGATKPSDSKLFAITVGTDRYDDKEYIPKLSFAKADASRFADSVRKLKGTIYTRVEVTPFLDARDLRSILPAKLREIAAAARATDTIMLLAAGHGFLDQATGQFYLATRETRRLDLKQTAIGWHEIAAALDGTKARVLVLLDACHSGSADGGANDDAVSSLLKAETSITVLAASKGRQASLEDSRIGGGRFTTALVRAITTRRAATDSNRNGAIELAELYGAVKREVLIATSGAQTPWIARNLMVGEIPLF